MIVEVVVSTSVMSGVRHDGALGWPFAHPKMIIREDSGFIVSVATSMLGGSIELLEGCVVILVLRGWACVLQPIVEREGAKKNSPAAFGNKPNHPPSPRTPQILYPSLGNNIHLLTSFLHAKRRLQRRGETMVKRSYLFACAIAIFSARAFSVLRNVCLNV